MTADVHVDGALHELIPLSAPERWRAALEGVPHAFAHGWDHCRAFSLSSRLPTFLYSYRSEAARVVCPLSERQYGGERDVFTPYGFAGPSASRPIPGFAAEWEKFAEAQGWVCAYLQANPLLIDPLAPDSPPTAQNRIYVLDLRLGDDELLARMSRGRRRQLDPDSAGSFSIDPAGEDAADFLVEHAPDFFADRSASSLYQFAAETWRALARAPGTIFLAAKLHGETQAVGIFGTAGEQADYLFNICTSAGRPAAAALTWEGVRRCRAMGCTTLNLGGGIRPDDDVAKFKERFGAEPKPFMTHRFVFRSQAFGRLCAQAGVAHDAHSAYFPPYHAPVAG